MGGWSARLGPQGFARIAGVVACVGLVAGCGRPAAPAPASGPEAPVAEAETTAAPVRSQSEVDPTVLDGLVPLEALALPVVGAGEAARRAPADAQAFRGPGPAAVPEPARSLRRDAPQVLLASALEALTRGDEAGLARACLDPAAHPTLTEDDAACARRRFLTPAVRPYWDKVRRALRDGRCQVSVEGRRATVELDTGGALGRARLSLRQEDDGWYLDR